MVMKIETRVGYVKKYDLTPKKADLCGQCRDREDDVCVQDEICIARLAKALGKSAKTITSSLDLASQRGLITLRKAKRKGRSVPMIKITDEGRMVFGTIKK